MNHDLHLAHHDLEAIAVVVAAVGSRDIASIISPDDKLHEQVRALERKLEKCITDALE